MKISVLVQARLGSTRFPRKVLADVEGQSMLARVAFRALRIPGVDDVFVIAPSSDAETLRPGSPVPVLGYPGDPHDVLDRYDWAARQVGADVIMRVTADCPCLDPELSGAVLRAFLGQQTVHGIVDNIAPNTDGFDTQVFSARTLRLANLDATDPYEREHVCPWMEKRVPRDHVAVEGDCPKLSVDTEEELGRVRHVYRILGREFFSRAEVLDALRTIPLVA